MKVLSGSTDSVVRGALGTSGKLVGFLWAFIPLVSLGPQSDEQSGVLLNTCRLKPTAELASQTLVLTLPSCPIKRDSEELTWPTCCTRIFKTTGNIPRAGIPQVSRDVHSFDRLALMPGS